MSKKSNFRNAKSNANKNEHVVDITGNDVKIDDLASVLRYTKAHLMVFADTSADAIVGDEEDKKAALIYIREASDKLNKVIRYAIAYNAKCNKPENRDVHEDVEREADNPQNGKAATVRIIKVAGDKDLFDYFSELFTKLDSIKKENGNNV